jgi:NAD-dependent dihydropyrimidine dehydrogenase PreA subunit
LNIDLSQYNGITNRVDRAKAKSQAVREAKQLGGASSTEKPDAQSGEPVAAGMPPSKAQKPGLPVLEFKPGLHFKWNGRAARVVSTRYDLVSFAYDDDQGTLHTADRYRLSHEHSEGRLVFAPRGEAYRPDRVASFGRVGFHDYLWLEGRGGMTAKKRRPRQIAIINPDYCTGCNACIEVCPTDCIEEVDVSEAGLDGIGKFCEVRLADCIGCVQCVHICPWEAIEMVGTDAVEKAYGLPAGVL